MSKKSVLDLISIGTLQKRHKQKKLIEELKNESKNAIEQVHNTYRYQHDEEVSILELGEKKKLEPLIKILIEWINEELAERRVIVKDLQEDLYDGLILQMLLKKLTNEKISEDCLKLGENSRRQYLKNLVDLINEKMKGTNIPIKWKFESIYDKDLISILHLLVALIKHYQIKIRLPDNIAVRVLVVKKGKTLEKTTLYEQITGNENNEYRREKDTFDFLFTHSKEKLELVKKHILSSFQKFMKRLNIELEEIDSKLDDGVYLIMLIGLLQDYYIPDYCYHKQPCSYEQKIENIQFLFELLEETQFNIPLCRPEDIAQGDTLSILRILYHIFSNYQN